MEELIGTIKLFAGSFPPIKKIINNIQFIKFHNSCHIVQLIKKNKTASRNTNYNANLKPKNESAMARFYFMLINLKFMSKSIC